VDVYWQILGATRHTPQEIFGDSTNKLLLLLLLLLLLTGLALFDNEEGAVLGTVRQFIE
jgi:hypothetical protein